ncbi:hypothetical protein C8R44DRAFT_792069 [Mycena epipterygia]|nr:hypothetical protein C8R44DRAFT_792069 [Mycena epipterygia]
MYQCLLELLAGRAPYQRLQGADDLHRLRCGGTPARRLPEPRPRTAPNTRILRRPAQDRKQDVSLTSPLVSVFFNGPLVASSPLLAFSKSPATAAYPSSFSPAPVYAASPKSTAIDTYIYRLLNILCIHTLGVVACRYMGPAHEAPSPTLPDLTEMHTSLVGGHPR